MGYLLQVLLGEVLEDPKKNTRDYLLKRARELKDADLEKLNSQAKTKIEGKKINEEQILKRKHWVK